MSVPSTREPQKLSVSQITRGLNALLKAAYKYFPIVGTQMSGWQT